MKSKYITFLSVVVLSSVVMSAHAHALGVGVGADAKVDTKVIDANVRTNSNASATSTYVRENNEAKMNANAQTNVQAQGEFNAEAHRSSVAASVQKLINVADREGGIGAEVRVIARTQNDSASTSPAAIAKIENRSSFKTMLVGSDYESVGTLRSEITTTRNNIERLKTLRDRTVDIQVKAEIDAQIQVLEESQVKLNTFVEAHENTFSLFGWFVKLFR